MVQFLNDFLEPLGDYYQQWKFIRCLDSKTLDPGPLVSVSNPVTSQYINLFVGFGIMGVVDDTGSLHTFTPRCDADSGDLSLSLVGTVDITYQQPARCAGRMSGTG